MAETKNPPPGASSSGENPTLNAAQNVDGEPSKKRKRYLLGPYSPEEGFQKSPKNVTVEGTRVYLSNLAFAITAVDIMGLFSEFQSVKHCTLHYDRFGIPLGFAEVVFSNLKDAMAAVKELDNNLYLDYKKVKLTIGVEYSDVKKMKEEGTEMKPL